MAQTASASLAALLKYYRAAGGQTQEELAERANLSARAISDLERGISRRPQAYTVQRLVQALGLETEEAAQFEHAARRVGSSTPTPGSLDGETPYPMHLPIQPTPFIGRQREVREVSALLLREDVRLLTLTGPGGTGKTRLALRVAEEVRDAFPDGVCFVSLASLLDPELVPVTLATALGVKEVSGQPILTTMTRYLQSRQLLLLVDNFEHLLPASDVVSQLLVTCPRLQVLVTSRAVLHLAAEHEYPVPPLVVPTLNHLPDLDALSRYDAVQLFVQRAEAVTPDFQLTAENAAAIAEICHRVDGLPLAIELAAARIKLFPPQALLGRLQSRLHLLTGGPLDQPTRQQTLRNTIDWSYSLLSEDERTLFARLSVFAGGCSLEAVEQVCDPEGQVDVLAALTGLVEKNLLMQRGSESVRCQMLETLREYSAERLSESGEAEELERRHAAYYLALRERVGPNGAESTLTNRIESEHDNVRRAMGWLFRHEREGSLPSEERPTVGARFDAVYLSIAHSPTLERIQQKVYGDEYPTEVKPFGNTTWSDLQRMVSELAVGPGQRFVDLGCGEGGAGLWLARETGASVIGIDISSVAITRARARIEGFGLVDRAQYEVGDITSTLLSPLSCDGAICIDVLWMIPDTVAALSEAARILRAGARLILTTWEFPPRALEDADATDYRAALAAAGFDVEAYDPIEAWEGQFRALLASYEAARNDLAREFGEEMAENFIEFERQRAALLPEWKRVFIKARRV